MMNCKRQEFMMIIIGIKNKEGHFDSDPPQLKRQQHETNHVVLIFIRTNALL